MSASRTAVARNVPLDLFKIFLAILVVGIHVTLFHPENPLVHHLVVNGLCRLGVPMFFMISGYYFHNLEGRPARQRNWILTIVALYAIWMLIHLPLWLPPLDDPAKFVRTSVKIILTGYFQLWYLVGLIGGALILLVLRRLPDALFLTALGVLIVGGVALQYIELAGGLDRAAEITRFASTDFYRNFIFMGAPFFILGWLMNRAKATERVGLTTAVLASAAGLVLLMAEAWAAFATADERLHVDLLASLYIACPALLLLFLKLGETSSLRAPASLALAYESIYFTHIILLSLLRGVAELPGWEELLIVTPIAALLFPVIPVIRAGAVRMVAGVNALVPAWREAR